MATSLQETALNYPILHRIEHRLTSVRNLHPLSYLFFCQNLMLKIFLFYMKQLNLSLNFNFESLQGSVTAAHAGYFALNK